MRKNPRQRNQSIQKHKQPQRDFITETIFKVICSDITIRNHSDLFPGFIFPPVWKINFLSTIKSPSAEFQMSDYIYYLTLLKLIILHL